MLSPKRALLPKRQLLPKHGPQITAEMRQQVAAHIEATASAAHMEATASAAAGPTLVPKREPGTDAEATPAAAGPTLLPKREPSTDAEATPAEARPTLLPKREPLPTLQERIVQIQALRRAQMEGIQQRLAQSQSAMDSRAAQLQGTVRYLTPGLVTKAPGCAPPVPKTPGLVTRTSPQAVAPPVLPTVPRKTLQQLAAEQHQRLQQQQRH